MRHSAILVLAAFATNTVACGSSSTEAETGEGGADALVPDAGASDSGSGTSDSGADSGAAEWARTAFGEANIVPALALDPKSSSTVFIGISAGSTEMGYFRTTDAGKTWTKLTGTLPDRYAGFISMHAQNGTLLANPGVEGIWRSTNGGDSWVQVATDPGGSSGLVFHPSGNMAWTITSQQGCFRSPDVGVTWTRAMNTNLPLNQFGLGPLVSDGTKLYLGTGSQGVYVSTDNCDSWTKATSTGLDGVSGADALNIVAPPSRPGVLFVQTSFAGIFKSTDSGATFTKLDPGGTGTRYPALALDPANAQTIFVSANETQGGPGGLFKSTDDGQTWENFGPSSVPVNSVAVASDGTIYAGTIGKGVWRYGK